MLDQYPGFLARIDRLVSVIRGSINTDCGHGPVTQRGNQREFRYEFWFFDSNNGQGSSSYDPLLDAI